MHAPTGYERPEQVIHLCKALYGLKQSPHQWFDSLKLFLCSKLLSLLWCPVDACLFMLVVGGIVVLLASIHVKELSHWLNCFGAKHVVVAKQCLRYLAGTK